MATTSASVDDGSGPSNELPSSGPASGSAANGLFEIFMPRIVSPPDETQMEDPDTEQADAPVPLTQANPLKKKHFGNKGSVPPMDKRVRKYVERRCRAVADKYEKVMARRLASMSVFNSAPSLLRELCTLAGLVGKRTPDKYSPAMKDFAVGFYKLSPRAYRYCQKYLPIPCPAISQRIIKLEILSRPPDYVEPKVVKTKFTEEQYKILREAFRVNRFPKTEGYAAFGEQFGCRALKVKKWFEKQREHYNAKQRRIEAGLTDESGSEEEEEVVVSEPLPSTEPEIQGPRIRTYFTQAQVAILEVWYAKTKFLNRRDAELVCREVGSDRRKVKRWFDNKRFKESRQGPEE